MGSKPSVATAAGELLAVEFDQIGVVWLWESWEMSDVHLPVPLVSSCQGRIVYHCNASNQ